MRPSSSKPLTKPVLRARTDALATPKNPTSLKKPAKEEEKKKPENQKPTRPTTAKPKQNVA